MYTVSIDPGRKFHIIVDDKGNAVRRTDLLHGTRLGFQCRACQFFFSELDHGRAARQRFFHRFRKRSAVKPGAVCNGVDKTVFSAIGHKPYSSTMDFSSASRFVFFRIISTTKAMIEPPAVLTRNGTTKVNNAAALFPIRSAAIG